MSVVTVERKILEKNDEVAARNRALFKQQGVFVINLVSSPGSGKTSVLERTLQEVQNTVSVAVIEGDVQTDLDAQRVARFNVPVVQIVTNGGCHLEANLVRDALSRLDLSGVQLLVIENVGNLVCPANYDLGEHLKVVIVSTTEGDDKPLKYPAMFRKASALIVNKIDLLPHIKCCLNELEGNALAINPELHVFETSCATGEGIAEWSEWILERIKTT
ncbi:MAG TPA: hydrogenase nickel incorporation protein HypB, partial [Bacteroidota bacterium]